ncbi:DUF6632 domain-containing protein [Nocardia neocaledoniensis]|uniref:DUF6632 domain-containing protein n=1 Tax=Nocardia neocaledoniensis TaxID=236511 RepID=UPI002454F6F4|nr:DUF6632 domain-containing protein [Nocardia neocaledoniensis]
MKVLGAAMAVFFGAAALGLLLDVDPLLAEDSGTLGSLLAWTAHGGNEYLYMLSVIYVCWGAYVWAASNDPITNRFFIDFTIVTNFAHMGVMALMAAVDSSHSMHLIGDIPLGFTLPIALTILWLPVRRSIYR